jgi:undecaprenyl diphosphate synthase
MTTSTLQSNGRGGLRVGILMDGNGRWAIERGRPRSEGHRAGAETVRRVVAAAAGLGIRALTLHGFSSDNWQRPADEVSSLLRIFEDYLREEAERCAAHGVRIRVIGRRDRFPQSLLGAIDAAERATAAGSALDLRVAVDYSARDAILRAACWMLSSLEVTQQEFARRLGMVTHADGPSPDVDLVIRTGGEQRLSDFLLWECAYAELYFTPRMWPDFTAADLAAAVRHYWTRERRFGRLPQAPAAERQPVPLYAEPKRAAR